MPLRRESGHCRAAVAAAAVAAAAADGDAAAKAFQIPSLRMMPPLLSSGS